MAAAVRPTGAAAAVPLLRPRPRLSPVVRKGRGCLHQALRNFGAFVRYRPAFRKKRRAFALFVWPSSALTFIAAPFPTLVSLSDCVTAFPAICTSLRFPLVSFLHPQPPVLRLRLLWRRHPPPCVVFQYLRLFWCHRLTAPRGTHSVFRRLFGPVIFFLKFTG